VISAQAAQRTKSGPALLVRPRKPQVMGPVEFRPPSQSPVPDERITVGRILKREYASCARSGCPELFEVSLRPGRPRRFCGDTCRRAAQRGSKRAATPRPPDLRSFSWRLHQAILASGLKLEEISDRLDREDGVDLPPSTLSNWRNGGTPQRRDDRDLRVYALERVLALNRRALLSLLDPPGVPAVGPPADEPPADPYARLRRLRKQVGLLGGVDGYITTRVRERFVVGAGDRHRYRQVLQTVLATDPNTDCYWMFAAADHPMEALRLVPIAGCRIGRRIQQGRLIAAELLFDRILRPDEEHTFEFRAEFPDGPDPEPFVRRWTSPPGLPALDSLELEVRFEVTPREVLACRWAADDQPPVDDVPVPVHDGVATLSLHHPVPGLYGLRWTS
jgi:hypothetical protein